MSWLRSFVERLTAEHVSWFGAGLCVAAAGVLGYQLVLAALPVGSPGPQPAAAASDGQSSFPTRTPLPTFTPFPTRTPYPTRTPFPTRTLFPTRTPAPTPTTEPTRSPRPTRTPLPADTPYPTHTPYPTATAFPTRTPTPEPPDSPDALATLVLADPDAVVGVVATFAARTNQAFDALQTTPRSRR
jgi:hypothetical protein